jgi:hypothetical protein
MTTFDDDDDDEEDEEPIIRKIQRDKRKSPLSMTMMMYIMLKPMMMNQQLPKHPLN